MWDHSGRLGPVPGRRDGRLPHWLPRASSQGGVVRPVCAAQIANTCLTCCELTTVVLGVWMRLSGGLQVGPESMQGAA